MVRLAVVTAVLLLPCLAGCSPSQGDKIADEITQEIHSYYIDGGSLPPVLLEMMPDVDRGGLKNVTATLISTGTIAESGERMPAAIVRVAMDYSTNGKTQTKCLLIGQGDSGATGAHWMGAADCTGSMDEWKQGELWQDN